jgi:hypothetical protein
MKKKEPIQVPRYTHKDKDGIKWRFVGQRPVSEIADKVMKECRMRLR